MRRDERFEVGDRVRLNSGSPEMTIENIHHDTGKLVCTYFLDGRRQVETLPEPTVYLVKRGEP